MEEVEVVVVVVAARLTCELDTQPEGFACKTSSAVGAPPLRLIDGGAPVKQPATRRLQPLRDADNTKHRAAPSKITTPPHTK